MPVSADDVSRPVDNDATSDPAAQGAAELRAIKTKLNNIFLNAGIDADGPKLITMNGQRGYYNKYSLTPADNTVILYGWACDVYRTGADNHTVGGQFNARLQAGTIGGGVWGIATEAWSYPASSPGILVGAELSTIQQNAAYAGSGSLGLYLTFKNRPDGAAAPTSGIGANRYNKGATAISIASQPRGTSGEYCGWNKGIYFDTYSMDLDNGAAGSTFDASQLFFTGSHDPRTAYRIDSVVRMRDFQSILWTDLGSPEGKTRIFRNPDNARLVVTQESGGSVVERFGIDLGNGNIYKNGILVL